MSELKKIAKHKPGCLLMGGSAGAFELIYQFISALPADFPIPVVVILHRGKEFKSNLKQLLQSRAVVKVKEAEEKEPLVDGMVYLAPVNFHLLIEPDRTLSIDASEPVLYSRPSIDVTFSSAADIYRTALVSMLFSGANADGSQGSFEIENKGGAVLVHDPEEAEVDTMPLAAITRLKYPLLFRKSDFTEIIELLSQNAAKTKNPKI